MQLLPLPTAKVSQREEKNHSTLPYPELSQRQPTPQAKPAMSKEWGTHHNKASTEQQRMTELENMLNEAQSRAAIVEQEAYDKAYAAGEKAGLALGEKRAEQIIETMEEVVSQAKQELHHLQTKSVAVVIEIAEMIVSKVMGEQDISQRLEKAVAQALEQLNLETHLNLVLAVHPKDLAMFARMMDLPEKIKLRAYEQVKQGSCKLLSSDQDILIDPQGMIDKAVLHIRNHLIEKTPLINGAMDE